MPKERHYIPFELFFNQEITLEGSEYHHLVTVMRAKRGETIELVNGLGDYAKATIIDIQKKRAILQIHSSIKTPKDPVQIILAQAIPRLNRLDFILEKGTELGMTQLWLFPGAHSEKKILSTTQLERLNHLAIAALKQCGRLFLPEILIKPSLEYWTKPDMPLYFGSFSPEAPLFMNILGKNKSPSGIFCVGPESGLSVKEEEILKNLGGLGTSLNRNTLRAETASMAALAIMQHCALIKQPLTI